MERLTIEKLRNKLAFKQGRIDGENEVSHNNQEKSRWNAAISVASSKREHGLDSSGRSWDDDCDRSSDDDGDRGDHKETENPLAKRETRAVTRLKVIVMMVLLLCAVGTATLTYFYIHNSENAQFQQGYENSAHKLLEAIRKSLLRTLESLDNLAVATVSHARSTNQTWPTVTVPDFAMRAAKMMSLSDAVFVALLPRVTNDTRLTWERYAATHDQWFNQSVHLQENYDLFHGPIKYATGHTNVIWGDFGDIEYNLE